MRLSVGLAVNVDVVGGKWSGECGGGAVTRRLRFAWCDIRVVWLLRFVVGGVL